MNDIKRYKKDIRALFPVFESYEKRFYTDLIANITEYTKNHENTNYADLREEFGSPPKIICDYLSNVDPKYLSKKLRRSKYIKISCFFIVVACMITLCLWGRFYHRAYLDFYNALPAIEETTIETNN